MVGSTVRRALAPEHGWLGLGHLEMVPLASIDAIDSVRTNRNRWELAHRRRALSRPFAAFNSYKADCLERSRRLSRDVRSSGWRPFTQIKVTLQRGPTNRPRRFSDARQSLDNTVLSEIIFLDFR